MPIVTLIYNILIRSGGFYSIDYNGIRIISLQTNYCNKQNW